MLERLSFLSRSVVGIDPDSWAIMRARVRIDGLENVRVIEGDFMELISSTTLMTWSQWLLAFITWNLRERFHG
ncbi:methyltransferase domain-containing protein [Acidithrix ferrooxidans]|uniref:Uncharacterized protein n=1 Tax=Acidithrix ferrooxidans TaxID=1280514 RepID=A0A0D8HIN8_9ACTN|nr:class I SAM-dependent methyltransferase [Acidithrix ferrooxidans]KJF17803.1 hypothetical protein AXFE_13000 [Acidithrix ferrooxidans]CAG4925299.1 unnamed protein product [Acidithrix sp. C25]